MSNIITLDNIKGMNIDKIVNLYRQGYTLENTGNTYVDSLQVPDGTVDADHIANTDRVTHADILLILGVSLFSIYTAWQMLTSKNEQTKIQIT